MSIKKFRKPIIIILVAVMLIAIALYFLMWKKWNDFSIGNILPSLSNKAFKDEYPQFKELNTSKENCFDLWTDSWKSNIECFVPDNLDEFTKNMADPKEFKNKLSASKLAWARELDYEHKSEFLQFYDTVQPTPNAVSNRYLKIREELQKRMLSPKATANDISFYSYMMSLEWNYKDAIRYNNELCKKFSKNCEKDKVSITITWSVKTSENSPLRDVKIDFMWYEKSVLTDWNWNYSLKFKTFPQQKIRIQASKKWYSIWVAPFDILANVDNQTLAKDFILNSPSQNAIIDTKNQTIEWKWTSSDNKYYIIRTDWSEYKIPKNALKRSNWESFTWKINVYLFEFNKSTNLNDLLQNDIFDDVAWYAGNLMKTFWMPFILFVTDDGEKIHIFKNNPMILKNKIQEMEALRTNKDQIYSPLTDKDMEYLVDNSSKLWGYPIDRQFLIDNDMLRFPVFWVFDQYRWVWVGLSIKVLSKDWDIESLFYTTSEKL